MEWYWPASVDELDLPGYHPVTFGDPVLVAQAAELIAAAKRPVLYVGGGVLKARAAEALRALAERTGIPVVTTLMARGAFPDSHPQCLGMPGMHGNYTAVTAMQQSDLLINLGARFDDRVTGKIDAFAPEAKVIHVDIDPAELGKVRVPTWGSPATAGWSSRSCCWRLAARDAVGEASRPAASAPWWDQLHEWQEQFPLHYAEDEGGAIKPQNVVEALRDASPVDTIVVAGVGQHQMWASQYWRFDYPYTWVNSGGAGTMGFAVPGGHRGQGGAAGPHGVGHRRRRLLPDDGSGAGHRERRTYPGEGRDPQQRLPGHGPPVAGDVLRGALLGGLPLARPARLRQVGRSHGLRGHPGRDRPRTWLRRSRRPTRIDDRPVVIDFRTDAFEKVFPMVPAGASNDDIVVHPDQAAEAR